MNKRFSIQAPQHLKKRKGIISLLSLCLFFALVLAGFGRGILPNTFGRVKAASQQGDNTASLWQEVDEKTIPAYEHRNVNPEKYRTLRLNVSGLKQLLSAAPLAQPMASRDTGLPVSLPMPDGSFARFLIVEAPIMEPELAKRSPEIKTYRGQGIDDPTATMRCSLTPLGFQTLILSSTGTFLIESYAKNDVEHYLSYNLKDLPAAEAALGCSVKEMKKNISALSDTEPASLATQNVSFGATLRTYKLAIGATHEYTALYGNDKALAKAAITAVVNQITLIYERDLAVSFTIVADEEMIIYNGGQGESYPYPANPTDLSTLFTPNQNALDNKIGYGNYDIGQVFGVGNYGVAARGVVCSSTKAHGVSTSPSPSGIGFVLLAAHEMAHQFNATHTYNGSTGYCGNFLGGNQRASESAYEPGSGSTIMSYAGSCAGSGVPTQNIAGQKDAYFHTKSIEQMNNFIGAGGCAGLPPTNNTPPTVEAGQNYIIPRATPFTLTAVASDLNADPLTYTWEEYDLGAVSPPDTDADGQARPIFRSRPPTTSASRTFPDLAYIRDYANVPPTYLFDTFNGLLTGEILPQISRTMQFIVTARDNRLNGGGVASDNMQVTVDGNSEPFFVTAPSQPVMWETNTTQTVTWNVGNTAISPINCAMVKITLSTDGGTTFPITLSASTPNDGSESISLQSIPATQNLTSTTARIKVEAVGNIFFDISDMDFIIKATGCTYALPISSGTVGSGATPGGTYNNVSITTNCAWMAKSNVDWLTFKPGNESGIGNGTIKYQVTGNNYASRIAKISVGGLVYTVTQSGSCNIQSISPVSGTFASYGGSGTIAVDATVTTVACLWTATSNVPWVAITSGTNGTGDGTVKFSVAVNTSTSSRSGTLIIGGQTYNITQNGASIIGSMTAGCFEPGNGNWYLKFTNAIGAPDMQFEYGASIYLPVVGDWNNDGVMTVGCYEPATGIWYLKNNNSVGNYDITFTFGGGNYIPVAGDWDGNGTWTAGLYDASSGNWYLRNNFNSGAPGALETPFSYGGSQYKPVVGDWDGNGTTTIGCYEPGNGNWYLRNSNSAGSSLTPFSYGGGSYIPVVGDWNGDGVTTIGCYDQGTGTWYLKNSNSAGAPEITFQYGGGPSYKPVVGKWH
jgi:hypothetical protein